MFGKKEKEKVASPKDILAGEIERLTPGQSLQYKLPPLYGNDLVVIRMNPDFSKKGKKYRVDSESLVDGKSSGKIHFVWDTDKPRDIASWVLERLGVPLS